jgi:transposase
MQNNYSKKRLENLKKNKSELDKKKETIKNAHNMKKTITLLMIIAGIPTTLAASIISISTRTIYNWITSFLINPKDFTHTKIQKGRKSKLTDEQKEQLKKIVVDGPIKAGYSRGTWTAKMIQEIIYKKFKVTYNSRYVTELLKKLGFSYTKGKFISAKAEPEEIEKWKFQTWPELLERAKKEGIKIIFGDEASFALWGSLGYTWTLKGKQALVETTGQRKKLKVFGALDYFTGMFTFSTLEGKLNSDSFIEFLKKVLVRFQGKIFFITDSAPYHKSKKVTTFLEENKNRIELIPLPAYTPEYNLVEYVWRQIKSFTHNVYFPDFSNLKKFVRYRLKVAQKNHKEILNLCDSYPKILRHNFRESIDIIGS